jgi:hypothetical protein
LVRTTIVDENYLIMKQCWASSAIPTPKPASL